MDSEADRIKFWRIHLLMNSVAFVLCFSGLILNSLGGSVFIIVSVLGCAASHSGINICLRSLKRCRGNDAN